ncbi:hypothetical protein PG997_002845 [Apiospora hydei]|uniref:Uncharacterized protein n=1 Tax=Apiospora hydei TaxID=1337664 RepID=A0ABR1WXJ7_9PEZI
MKGQAEPHRDRPVKFWKKLFREAPPLFIAPLRDTVEASPSSSSITTAAAANNNHNHNHNNMDGATAITIALAAPALALGFLMGWALVDCWDRLVGRPCPHGAQCVHCALARRGATTTTT